MYNATDGTYWQNNENWLSDLPLNEWFGVTADDDGRVSEIDLYGNWLNGHIPTELSQLEGLQRLDLSWGRLSGEIPPEIGLLSNLTHLELRVNRLTGPLPAELGELPNLIHLDLHGNRLGGEIPSSLVSSLTLIHLDLSYNQLSGGIPREFAVDSQLETLDLSDNRLTFEIPYEIERLRNLEHLRLSRNRLEGEIPPGIGKLDALREIELQHNRLTGEVPNELSDLRRLHTLHLDDNDLTGNIPQSLTTLDRLRWLGLVDNNLSGCVPTELREIEFSNVEYANIGICGEPPRTDVVLPDYIEMAIGDAAFPSQVIASRWGVQWLADFMVKIGWPKPINKITVYVDDFDGLVRAWSNELTGCDLQCARADLQWIGGTALRGATFNQLFQISDFGLDRQVNVVAHEIIHAIQYDLVDRLHLHHTHRDPEWWIEGVATLVADIAVADGSGESLDEARRKIARTAQGNYVQLTTLDEERGPCAHYCGAAAVDLLAMQVGLRKLTEFYTERTDGGTWQETFERIFNIGVPDFYELFDEHHRNGYPLRELPIVGDTNWPAR